VSGRRVLTAEGGGSVRLEFRTLWGCLEMRDARELEVVHRQGLKKMRVFGLLALITRVDCLSWFLLISQRWTLQVP
jgi:hypothetical protein